VALEAFMEGYHVGASHPQMLRWSDCHTWSRAEGKHSCFGNSARTEGLMDPASDAHRPKGPARDHRREVAAFMESLRETVGLGTLTTDTLITAAQRLPEVLPETATAGEARATTMRLAREIDAERGVVWPTIAPAHNAMTGSDWHIFPNTIFLHGPTHLLGYRARPHGEDPDSCIFEVYALERFPPGQEPQPPNVYQPDISTETWQLVLCQDFQNMPEVQKGMKTNGFGGCAPSPIQEKPIINFHRNLAKYMGYGSPKPMKSGTTE
jgi:hypothetical protein